MVGVLYLNKAFLDFFLVIFFLIRKYLKSQTDMKAFKMDKKGWVQEEVCILETGLNIFSFR